MYFQAVPVVRHTSTLQKAGFTRYQRGRIEVTDRPGLESVACECYGVVRRASDRLFGMPEGARDTYRP
ncbi:hypothetical protein GCM10011504_57380 [Siccirubricoccus deserti]|nr:hypothetical protein GCM10011504_57380 [Siccirubricoccus deserti]